MGRTVLVTRAAEDAATWVAAIERAGHRGLALACIATELLRDDTTAARLEGALAGAEWLVLTSRRGVRAVAGLLGRRLPDGLRLAVVGPATADEAAELLGPVTLVPDEPTGAGLAAALLAQLRAETAGGAVRPPRVAVAAADRAGRELERRLEPEGVEVRRVTVYRTRPAPVCEPRHELARDGIDTILLASPSAVEGLLNQALVPRGAAIITIGPTTTEAAHRAGLQVTAEAPSPSLGAMLEAIP
jgi:uroporphyrinogen-III synthase